VQNAALPFTASGEGTRDVTAWTLTLTVAVIKRTISIVFHTGHGGMPESRRARCHSTITNGFLLHVRFLFPIGMGLGIL
jgi:hypothetical protein